MANILIIDDDPDLCDMLSEYLAGEGHSVALAHDAVVLDIMMPVMDGLKVLRLVAA